MLKNCRRSTALTSFFSCLLCFSVSLRLHSEIIGSYGSIPLIFESNLGQTDKKVQFFSRNPGFQLFISGPEAVLKFRGPALGQSSTAGSSTQGSHFSQRGPGAVLRLRWLGAQSDPVISGEAPFPGVSHYFKGRNPEHWIRNVPHYARVRLRALYPGMDLVYYDCGGDRLECDWNLAPGSAPSRLQLGIEGARSVRLDSSGNAALEIGDERFFSLQAPVAYQPTTLGRQNVSVRWIVQGATRLGLVLGSYDPTLPLVIDPAFVYSTYFGNADQGNAITSDSSGNAYITGETDSSAFPVTSGALDPSKTEGQEIFVSKLSPDGQTLLYSTYVGGDDTTGFLAGSDISFGNAIAIDSAENAYITGVTTDPDFPLVNAFQPTCGPCNHFGYNPIVFKLDSLGKSLIYSTYLGGSSNHGLPVADDESGDVANGITVDNVGEAVVVGQAASPDFPTVNAFQATCARCVTWNAGTNDAFITKISADGRSLIFSTFYGLAKVNAANCVTLDSTGNIYFGGSGRALPINPLWNLSSGDPSLLAELPPDGSSPIFSTSFGSGSIQGIAIDASGALVITGMNDGTDLPLVQAIQSSPTPIHSAFAARLSPKFSTIFYSTYLGGTSAVGLGSIGTGVAVDSSGNACFGGYTTSEQLALFNPLQSTCLACSLCPSCINSDASDGYIQELDSNTGSLLFGTYFGGRGSTETISAGIIASYYFYEGDQILGISADGSGDILVTGRSQSFAGLPLIHDLQNFEVGTGYLPQSAFVSKISLLLPNPTATQTVIASPTVTFSQTVTQTPNFTNTPSPTATPSMKSLLPNGDLLQGDGVYPNPFGDRVSIAFILGSEADVTLTFYTVAGEPIRHLSEHFPEGVHIVTWDGINVTGGRCASGVYLVSVRASSSNGASGSYWLRVACVR